MYFFTKFFTKIYFFYKNKKNFFRVTLFQMADTFYYFFQLLIRFFFILYGLFQPRELMKRIKRLIKIQYQFFGKITDEGSSIFVKPKNLAVIFVDEKLINFVSNFASQIFYKTLRRSLIFFLSCCFLDSIYIIERHGEN